MPATPNPEKPPAKRKPSKGQNKSADQPRGKGKPPKLIDLQQVEEMAAEFNTQADIATDMGFSRDLFVIREDVRDAYMRGIANARMSVRAKLFKIGTVYEDKQVLTYLSNKYDKDEASEADAISEARKLLDGVRTGF